MTTGSKNKLLWWALGLLIVANIATITMFWLNKPGKPSRKTPAEFIIGELKLDDKQKSQYEAMVLEHRKAVKEIRALIGVARDSFFNLLKTTNVNDSTKIALERSVTDRIGRLDILTFDHFMQLRNICNPEQQKKFDLIIDDVLRMMAGPPARPGGPPGGHPDHDPPPGD